MQPEVLTDPHPYMSLQYALEALRLQFGAGNVKYDDRNRVVTVQTGSPGSEACVPHTLTIPQAKDLVARPRSLCDLAGKQLAQRSAA
jgi:hypothetical protein